MRKLQQGDVVLKSCKQIPDKAKKVAMKSRGFVLAEGETTGHCHVVRDETVELFEADGVLYLKAIAPTSLEHTTPSGTQADHNPIAVDAGIWQVGIVKEFDPFQEEVRNVRD
jgi:hypothetical protein